MFIRIAGFLPLSLVNGPGRRAVLWMQGCNLGCAGCWNPEMHSFSEGKLVSLNDVFARIVDAQQVSHIEGVTYSGGEPFLQAEPLAILSSEFKMRGLSLFVFSGFTVEEIHQARDPNWDQLLSLADVLVDGRFDARQPSRKLWRSSLNQRVHFLTDRYLDWARRIDLEQQQTEITIQDGGRLVLTGFPRHDLLRLLGKIANSQS